ncbi:MAG: DUF6390 family protein [Acidimicrobiales bacterium]
MTGPGPTSPTPGPVLFARYAYPPHALGYCGTGDPSTLLDEPTRVDDLAALARRASHFEGAWPYLRLLAACNGIADPLDRRVVEAYWVGNGLLAHVPPSALADGMGGHAASPGAVVPDGGVPQHSFHVFAVYPWLGLLRAGVPGPPLEVLDRCRIRWGRVEAVDGELVTVSDRALAFDGSHLRLGPHRVEQARWRLHGKGFVADLRPGETVSLHWDWVCDRLSPTSLGWLRYCTLRNLEAVNATATVPPAPVGQA